MQFHVPQFIEIEDKIIGPLTLKQFLWLLAAAVILFILWTALPLALFILAGLPVLGFFGILAFYKINGRPFIYFLTSGFKFLIKPKLHLWQKPQKIKKEIIKKTVGARHALPKIKPRLSELAWKLDAR